MSSGERLWPSAVMSVWFVVTRARLFTVVGQLAKNDGVVKNPTRVTSSTISFAPRSLGITKNCSSGAGFCAVPRVTVTMRQSVKSVAASSGVRLSMP